MQHYSCNHSGIRIICTIEFVLYQMNPRGKLSVIPTETCPIIFDFPDYGYVWKHIISFFLFFFYSSGKKQEIPD